MDWASIAKTCSTTKGAASKRYSRLKLAFERGDGPPGSPAKDGTPKPKATPKSTPKSTPKKATPKSTGWTPINASPEHAEDDAPPGSSKRKRTAPKKKGGEQAIKTEPESEDEVDDAEAKEAKRPRVTKKKIAVKEEVVDDMLEIDSDALLTPCPEEGPLVKDEYQSEDEAYFDAHERLQRECKFILSCS